MNNFEGFPDGKVHLTPVPAPFFSELLPKIDDFFELKLSIYVFWKLEQMEGAFRYVRRDELSTDEHFMAGMGEDPPSAQAHLEAALDRAVERGTLLKASLSTSQGSDTLYFLNSPKGRAALRAIQAGEWRPQEETRAVTDTSPGPTNIFQLYEENIGPLTPLLAESLGEAEDTYPSQWIEDAMRIAVEKNKRNWRYISAILERWQREGRHGQKEKPQDRRDPSKDYRRYVEGEYSDFIEH
jgi:DnaD/phage-associated family protein